MIFYTSRCVLSGKPVFPGTDAAEIGRICRLLFAGIRKTLPFWGVESISFVFLIKVESCNPCCADEYGIREKLRCFVLVLARRLVIPAWTRSVWIRNGRYRSVGREGGIEMNRSQVTEQLTNFFEESFRSLKPNRLSSAILELCHDRLEEQSADAAVTAMQQERSAS